MNYWRLMIYYLKYAYAALNFVIIISGSDLLPVWHQAITWTNAELLSTGPRLNIKTVLSTYGDFHVKDKTAVRTSYL